jgi:hypothetical protein
MRFFYILLILLVVSCGKSKEKEVVAESADLEAVSTDSKCETETSFGDIDICFPHIKGMKECYSDPRVKTHVDYTGMDGNVILGYYFSDETYANADQLGEIAYDDYFKVYAVEQLKNMKITSKDMNDLKKVIEETTLKSDWNAVKNNIEKQLEGFSFGKPILIESYQPRSDIWSFLTLMNVVSGDQENTLVMNMSMVKIKDRLIYYAHYLDYEDEETLKSSKTKSDRFGLALLSLN